MENIFLAYMSLFWRNFYPFVLKKSYATLIEKIAILQKNNPVFFYIFSTLQIVLQNLQLNVA